MGSARQIHKTADLSPIRWIFGGVALVTLYIQINLFDPFNSPKLWALLIIASWLTGYIVSFKQIIFKIQPIKSLFYLVTTLIILAFFATIFASSVQTAVLGATQRRNGFISYLSLAIIIIAAGMFVRFYNIRNLFLMSYFVGSVTVLYALMQTTNNDFIKWNNPYNPIITTLGNPNFAAAVMAVMGVLVFSAIFIGEHKIFQRIFSIILTIFLFVAIYKSNARQGLLSFIVGIGLFLFIWFYSRNKTLGVSAGIIGLIIVIISIFGMLQIGPLEKYLYKPSVTLRGYYWDAGIEMLRHHPFLGVGLDNYGYYFKQYREVTYPLKYGFDITSSNAHNTFIQFFATGGLFFGATYLILNLFILKRALIGLKQLNGNNKTILAGVFSAWVAFHAQSFVSIDNLGISIWGWVLGGSIIGLSISATVPVDEQKKDFQVKLNYINLSRVLVSGVMTLLAAILITFLYRGENNIYRTNPVFYAQTQVQPNTFKELNLKAINTFLIDPAYTLIAATNLIQGGFIDEGLLVVKNVHDNNPRDLDALHILAKTYEQTNRISEAIIYREKISKIDPWNANNYLTLGQDYKAQGELLKAKEVLDKILSFTSGMQIAEQAKVELGR